MKKLINGIIDFRQKSLAQYREKFSKLAWGQSPDTLFIACCDSRVVPNTFASTDPGDLFVLRNIGNLICPSHLAQQEHPDESTAAAIEFSIENLQVKDIIVCGHSDCAAIKAVIDGREKVKAPHLQTWLQHAEPAVKKFHEGFRIDSHLSLHNEISQINVIQQLEHLKTYLQVQNGLAQETLRIHGWWFDLATANVYHYDTKLSNFVLIDDQEAERMLTTL